MLYDLNMRFIAHSSCYFLALGQRIPFSRPLGKLKDSNVLKHIFAAFVGNAIRTRMMHAHACLCWQCNTYEDDAHLCLPLLVMQYVCSNSTMIPLRQPIVHATQFWPLTVMQEK